MPHEPTETTRQQVTMHTMVGTRQEIVADILGIDPKTLRRYYRKELDQAKAKANAVIGGQLYNKCIQGDTSSILFWMKTQAGFRETVHVDNTSSDGTMTPKGVVATGSEVMDALRRKHKPKPKAKAKAKAKAKPKK